MQKNKLIIILILILAITGVGAYKYLDKVENKNYSEIMLPLARPENVSLKTETRILPEKMKEYNSMVPVFSFKYPDDLSFKKYDEGNDSYSLVFEDKAGAKSFQIFFTPYFGKEITRSRILKDVPSGKFTEPIEIIIGGGIPALAFTSESDLGQMREVWFIRNNYLYEVTTYLDLDSWLAEIMKTWSFN